MNVAPVSRVVMRARQDQVRRERPAKRVSIASSSRLVITNAIFCAIVGLPADHQIYCSRAQLVSFGSKNGNILNLTA